MERTYYTLNTIHKLNTNEPGKVTQGKKLTNQSILDARLRKVIKISIVSSGLQIKIKWKQEKTWPFDKGSNILIEKKTWGR